MFTLPIFIACVFGVLQGAVLGPVKPHYDIEHAFDHFIEYVKKYEKKYEHGEAALRFENFKKTLELINKRNVEESTVTHGINIFADMSSEEFATKMFGFRLTGSPPPPPKPYEGNFTAPDSIDWRDKNVVTGVKNQANCGSCWTFSVVATIESQYAMKHGLQEFSEQQILDCDISGQNGCNGGDPNTAFQYIQQNGGLESEAEYPYVGQQSTCSFNAGKAVAKVTSTNPSAISMSEEELAEKVASYGPVSVVFCAIGIDTLSSGIFDGAQCKGHDLSNCIGPDAKPHGHAVTIVGYGSDQGTPYWLIKNSWGTTWGEQGYFRMKRGESLCGINNHVATVEVA